MEQILKFMDESSFMNLFENIVIQLSPIKNSSYRRNCKHTLKDYIKGIIEVLHTNISWRSYKGPINGRILNNKHNEFVKLGIYDKLYEECLKKYLKKNKTAKLKYQSIDSTFIKNEYGIEGQGRNKLYKSKKGVKLSAIVDSNGIPLGISIDPSNIHDSQLVENVLQSITVNTNTRKYRNHNRYKQYFLADAAYSSAYIRTYLMKKGYIPIIAHNKRNTKNKKLIKTLNKKQEKIYKKRIIIENFFSWIKKAPKIKHFYEKTVASYKGLLMLRIAIIIAKRSI